MVLVEKKFHIFFIRHPPKLDNRKYSLPKLEVEDPLLSFYAPIYPNLVATLSYHPSPPGYHSFC